MPQSPCLLGRSSLKIFTLLILRLLCFSRMFYIQNRYDSLVDPARTIFSQFVRLQNYPLFSFKDELYGYAKFPLQDKVRKFLMTFLRSLCSTIFSEAPYCGVMRIFHKLVKHYTITQVELKENALSDLSGIVNALGALEDFGQKKMMKISKAKMVRTKAFNNKDRLLTSSVNL